MTNKAALLAAKLRSLARAAGEDDLQPVVFPGGAAALGARSCGSAAASLWVLGDAELGARVLGPSLAIAARERADTLHLLLDDPVAAAVAARRASYFKPAVTVYEIRGTDLKAVGGIARAKSAVEVPPVALVALIERAGAEAVVEHGVLRAEVRGLEIGRVELVDSVEQIVVGVGRHDREAHRMANEVIDPVVALAALVGQITIGRRSGASPGLASNLARERWLRWIACRRPSLVGATELTPVDPPDPRDDLRAISVAPAVGTAVDGTPSVFAFSVGVDTNLVPAAADIDPTRELVVVVPEGDDDRITSTLVGQLRKQARLQTVPSNWPSMGD